jgi:hypothetical protein
LSDLLSYQFTTFRRASPVLKRKKEIAAESTERTEVGKAELNCFPFPVLSLCVLCGLNPECELTLVFRFGFTPLRVPGLRGSRGGGWLDRLRRRYGLDLFWFGSGSGSGVRFACLYRETGLDHRIIAAEDCRCIVETLGLEIKHRTGA